MISIMALANTLLKKSFEEEIAVSPMKLQKLVYFVYKYHLQKNHEKLFEVPFQVWKYGPVLRGLYDEFKSFGADRITRFAKDANGNVYVVNNKATDIMESVNTIWDQYKHYSGVDLSTKTHLPNTAWDKAVRKRQPFLSDEDINSEE